MVRTWATGSAHDDKTLDWLFDLRYGKDIGHIVEALQGGLDDGSVGACQTALLAAECVGWLRGAPADLHDDARAWVNETPMEADQAVVDLAIRAIDQITSRSALKQWWEKFQPDLASGWLEGVAALRERVLFTPEA
jgi:Domain of unknown function (DUF4259)